MARYVKDFNVIVPQQELFEAVNNYLMSEGYKYIRYDNEDVFKKGNGFVSGPTFIKISFAAGAVRIEAWMKYALLPGVYLGEMGLTGMMGFAVKGPLKQRVARIESMIMQYAVEQPRISYNSANEADELKKFKDLLDSGVITQEEFDAKKKQILGL